MAPPPLSTPSKLSGFSEAITTAASPLQASFSLSCRSPIRPSYDAGARRSFNAQSTAKSHGSQYLAPPSFLSPIQIQAAGSKVIYEAQDGDYDYNDDEKSTLLEDSPTEGTWFLQPGTPGLINPKSQQDEGKLGVVSAINIILGKTVGVGVYSVPSAIFSGVGSVGMTLLLWVIGSIISFCGLAVYLDLGTALPRSGGERVYLERILRRPRMLATCMFMSYVVLLGFSTPNAIVLGEYALYALDITPNRWNVRLIAVLAVSVLCYIHARHARLGLHLINILGAAKMFILAVVVISGVAGGLSSIGSQRQVLAERRLDTDPFSSSMPLSAAQHNFKDIWAGSSTQPYDYATALLKVIYCFRGYSTANQVLSDVKNPIRTLRVAAPIALAIITFAYLAINIAFFLVIDKDDFASAGVVVAGKFFTNVFGEGLGKHVLPFCVVITAAGNIAATSFAQARVNEELARDGLLPGGRFWTSSSKQGRSSTGKPRARHDTATARSPKRGLLLHWLVSVAVIVLPPPGRIYNFLVDIGGYPVSVISVAVSAGLLYLQRTPSERWSSPCRAPTAAVAVFAAANCLLVVLPWIPPSGGRGEDGRFAWFAYPATALAVLGSGALYWCWWRAGGSGSRLGHHHTRTSSEILWSCDEDEDDGGADAAQGLLANGDADADGETAEMAEMRKRPAC